MYFIEGNFPDMAVCAEQLLQQLPGLDRVDCNRNNFAHFNSYIDFIFSILNFEF